MYINESRTNVESLCIDHLAALGYGRLTHLAEACYLTVLNEKNGIKEENIIPMIRSLAVSAADGNTLELVCKRGVDE